MERRKYTREFKLYAVKLIKERGVGYAQASQDLGVHQTVLRKWVADFTYIWTAEGWLYVAAVVDLFSRRVVGCGDDRPVRHRRADDGDLAQGQTQVAFAPLGSGQPVHQRAVPAADGGPRHHLFDEPVSQLPGQCGDGELLLLAGNRAHGA